MDVVANSNWIDLKGFPVQSSEDASYMMFPQSRIRESKLVASSFGMGGTVAVDYKLVSLCCILVMVEVA